MRALRRLYQRQARHAISLLLLAPHPHHRPTACQPSHSPSPTGYGLTRQATNILLCCGCRPYSPGERQAIFYNLLACHAQLENTEKALEALEAVLRAGYASAKLYGVGKAAGDYARLMVGCVLNTGLHSSTFQLNLSGFCGIGGARRGCVARVKGVLGGV
jgi:hypothetical protein